MLIVAVLNAFKFVIHLKMTKRGVACFQRPIILIV